jgi:hypothetical protein
MLTYDIANLSIAGIINELFTLTSSLIGYFRIDRKNKNANTLAKENQENFTNGDSNYEKR